LRALSAARSPHASQDEAIKAAEREAELANKKAEAAATQLVEWSEGERAVIGSLKRMGKVVESPEFQTISNGFVEQNKHHFEFTDENKLEYTALHEQYVDLMEATLVDLAKVRGARWPRTELLFERARRVRGSSAAAQTREAVRVSPTPCSARALTRSPAALRARAPPLQDVNMEELITNLPEFMQARAQTQDPEGTASTIDFLLSLTDFSTFKNLMLAANMTDAAGPAHAMVTDSDAPLAAIARTVMPKVLVDTARTLLNLSDTTGAATKWSTAVDKKGELLMETATVNGQRFARLTMMVDLPVADTVKCMLSMGDPERQKWNQMAERVDVHSHTQEGVLEDTICTLVLKLPGVAKLIKSIPKAMTLRIAIENDLPAPGQVTYIMVGWDTKTNMPDTSSMAMTRVAILEPVAGGRTSIKTIDKQMQAVPEWVSNMWVSNTMAKQVKNVGAHAAGEPRAFARTRAARYRAAPRRRVLAPRRPFPSQPVLLLRRT
jgi:hypothetical protein